MYIEINGIPYCDATPLRPAEMDQIHAKRGIYPTCSAGDVNANAAAIRDLRPDLDVKVIDAPCPSYNDPIDDNFE
jgi:hypothetical protein